MSIARTLPSTGHKRRVRKDFSFGVYFKQWRATGTASEKTIAKKKEKNRGVFVWTTVKKPKGAARDSTFRGRVKDLF